MSRLTPLPLSPELKDLAARFGLMALFGWP
jgi:hypothetical protein